jgi:hypothetical protein
VATSSAVGPSRCIAFTSSMATRQGHSEQALDRHRSMAYLGCECSDRRAEYTEYTEYGEEDEEEEEEEEDDEEEDVERRWSAGCE